MMTPSMSPEARARRIEVEERIYGSKLRDEFAKAALQSGDASNWRDNGYTPKNGLSIIENTARHAYQIADAMLQARKTDKGE